MFASHLNILQVNFIGSFKIRSYFIPTHRLETLLLYKIHLSEMVSDLDLKEDLPIAFNLEEMVVIHFLMQINKRLMNT